MKIFRFYFLICASLACLLFGAGVSRAEDEQGPAAPPQSRVYLDSLTAIRYNPLGLIERAKLLYSRKIFESTNPLLRDTYWAAGAGLRLSPSNTHLGPVLEIQPLTVFQLRVSYEYLRYFKTFDNFQSFPMAEARWSDGDRKKNGNAYATYGHHYIAEPTFQVKVGYIAARTTFGLEYWDVSLHRKFAYRYWNIDGHRDKYFYDPTLDSLIVNKSFMWTNDTNLVFTSGRLTLGARFSGVFPGYRNEQMRLGPIFSWQFNTKDYTSFNRPTLILIVQWFLVHPSKKGPLPCVILAYSFSSDFMKSSGN